ncbi:uridine phosphorylase 2 isoform X2 [Neovison vison]|uniref:uridine phosphorylase 2 isoform X2 n=1 Tax=Neovison vison TaxID=452646 RepID=UPI001CF06C23|nr:uridine phosphorylase 2 isoform X2 [Neogale vison]
MSVVESKASNLPASNKSTRSERNTCSYTCWHGTGIPSISIMPTLHKLIKLLHHVWCCDVTVIRIGTSGRIVWGQPGGALESFSREEKLHCLKAAYKARVRNTEMESAMFIALCRFCGLKAPALHVTHLVGLKCDQISLPHEQQPQPLISNFIKQQLGFHDQMS